MGAQPDERQAARWCSRAPRPRRSPRALPPKRPTFPAQNLTVVVLVWSAVRVALCAAPRALTSLIAAAYFGLVSAGGGGGRNWLARRITNGLTRDQCVKTGGASGPACAELVIARAHSGPERKRRSAGAVAGAPDEQLRRDALANADAGRLAGALRHAREQGGVLLI